MKHDEMLNISIKLRRKLHEVMRDFWNEQDKNNLPKDDMFFINSVVIASLISQITYNMFKKDIGNKPSFTYIDDIVKFTKDQITSGAYLSLMGEESKDSIQ